MASLFYDKEETDMAERGNNAGIERELPPQGGALVFESANAGGRTGERSRCRANGRGKEKLCQDE